MCKARLVRGDLHKTRRHEFVIPEAEKVQGYFLACSHTNRGDIEIEAIEAATAADIPEQQVTTRVKKVKALSDQIHLLHVQTPRTQRLRFLAGQGARLRLADSSEEELPIASCPCDDRNLEFHVRTNNGSDFAHAVPQLCANQPVELVGPTGGFVLDEESQRPAVFLAYDTGFAPIKSLIEHAMQLEHADRIYLYWLANKNETHYMHNLARSWTDAFDNFIYKPLSTETDPEHIKIVVDDLLQRHPSLQDYDYYIAGSNAFNEVCRHALTERSVPQQQTYVEVAHYSR